MEWNQMCKSVFTESYSVKRLWKSGTTFVYNGYLAKRFFKNCFVETTLTFPGVSLFIYKREKSLISWPYGSEMVMFLMTSGSINYHCIESCWQVSLQCIVSYQTLFCLLTIILWWHFELSIEISHKVLHLFLKINFPYEVFDSVGEYSLDISSGHHDGSVSCHRLKHLFRCDKQVWRAAVWNELRNLVFGRAWLFRFSR